MNENNKSPVKGPWSFRKVLPLGLVIFVVDKSLITRVLQRLLGPATRPCYIDQ